MRWSFLNLSIMSAFVMLLKCCHSFKKIIFASAKVQFFILKFFKFMISFYMFSKLLNCFKTLLARFTLIFTLRRFCIRLILGRTIRLLQLIISIILLAISSSGRLIGTLTFSNSRKYGLLNNQYWTLKKKWKHIEMK